MMESVNGLELDFSEEPTCVNSGRWTREEHLLFVKGLKLYGRDWKRVLTMVPRRTSAQIRSHAQKYFKKLQKEELINKDHTSTSPIDETGNSSTGDGSVDDDSSSSRAGITTAEHRARGKNSPDLSSLVCSTLVNGSGSEVSSPFASSARSGSDLSTSSAISPGHSRPAKRRRAGSVGNESKSSEDSGTKRRRVVRDAVAHGSLSSSSSSEMQELELSALQMLLSVGGNSSAKKTSPSVKPLMPPEVVKEAEVVSPEIRAAKLRAIYGFNPDMFSMQVMVRDPLSGAFVMTPMPFTMMAPMFLGHQFVNGQQLQVVPSPMPQFSFQ